MFQPRKDTERELRTRGNKPNCLLLLRFCFLIALHDREVGTEFTGVTFPPSQERALPSVSRSLIRGFFPHLCDIVPTYGRQDPLHAETSKEKQESKDVPMSGVQRFSPL